METDIKKESLAQSFLRLVKIMDELREQCPWDRKQTIATLRPLTLEETYELADAIIDQDWQGIREELGDLMLHILFYARIGTEQKQFSLEEVMEGIAAKQLDLAAEVAALRGENLNLVVARLAHTLDPVA